MAKTPLGNTEKRGFYACGSPVAPVGGKLGTQFDAYSILLWLILIHPRFVVPAHIIPSDGGGQHVMLQHDVAGKPPLFHASTDQARKLEHVGSPVPRTHLPARISTTTCRPSSRSRRTASMLASISRRSDAQRMAEDLTTCRANLPARGHTYLPHIRCKCLSASANICICSGKNSRVRTGYRCKNLAIHNTESSMKTH